MYSWLTLVSFSGADTQPRVGALVAARGGGVATAPLKLYLCKPIAGR